LEVLSVSLYGLIAYLRTDRRGVEAGIKYLILAAVSSAFLLFGMALIYASLGTMEFSKISSAFNQAGAGNFLVLSGFSLMIVGIGFKLAVVPFHLWTPDVYEGAPAPVTAFVATVSKGGVFAILLRFFWESGSSRNSSLLLIFSIIAIASMFAGNLLALMQTNVKRILAYSSIAHLGYLLVAFLAGGSLAVESVTYYLVAYFITTIGAFGVVSALSGKEQDADAMENYRGLFWQRPWLAAIFTAMLLSLAGIPLTAGFVGKFYVLAAGVNKALWALVVILVINSAIGLYYYLRIVIAMYAQPEIIPTNLTENRDSVPFSPRLTVGGSALLSLLTLLLIWFGVYPAGLMQIIETMAAALR
jgi:NADH-quinone oxidoreductase subunit N